MNDYEFFTYAIIPFRDLKLAGEQLTHINTLRGQGWRVTYQQLMIFEGEPMLVVVLERFAAGEQPPAPQPHRPTNDAVSLPLPPFYDPNAGLAVPFPTQIEKNEVKEL